MENTSVTTLTDRQSCYDAVKQVIHSAEGRIAIFSQALEPLLYNHEEICDALSSLARSHRHAMVRVIAQSTRSAAADGHCVIRLAQRLSSYVQIRVPATQELQRFNQSWIIADNHSICEITNSERYEGQLIEHNQLHVRTQLDFFDHAWENSEPDIQTRRLGI